MQFYFICSYKTVFHVQLDYYLHRRDQNCFRLLNTFYFYSNFYFPLC